MIGPLYGAPMGNRRVPVVFDAGAQVGINGFIATVSMEGSYQITERDFDLSSFDLVQTRIYTGSVSGTSSFTVGRIPFSPRYLNPTSSGYEVPDPDKLCFIRHPRWLFPGIGTGTRGFSGNGPMALHDAQFWWNDSSPFSTTPLTDLGNLTVNVTRQTIWADGSSSLPPYDDNLDKTYHDNLGGIFRMQSIRGKVIWQPAMIVNVGTDYPITGSVNAEFYQYNGTNPFPSPGDQAIITDIHRSELGGVNTVTYDQPSAGDEATDIFTRTYDDWSMVWTWKLEAM